MFTIKNRVLLAKEEGTYNSDPTPTVAANAIESSVVKVNFNADLLTRDNLRSNISAVAPVVGKRFVEVQFTCELKGSGTAGVAPRIGDLIEACAFSEVASVGSSVVYQPCSSNKKSVTLYIYDLDSASAVLHKVTGAIGDVKLKATAGQYGVLDFTFRGNYNADADVALPSAPTYDTTVPPVVESCQLTVNSVNSLVIQEISLSMDNAIIEREDVNSANGLKGFEITGRDPKGTINPEAVLAATYNFTADWAASAQRALSMVVGSVAGNRVMITAPKLVIESVSDGDRNGLLTRDVPFRLGQNAGNDEVVLKFY
jgi:hypothetical protein